jgi:hypothetical protein
MKPVRHEFGVDEAVGRCIYFKVAVNDDELLWL